MNKAGRPTKYKSSYCQELIGLMAEGKFNCEVASIWDINEDTFYEWRSKYPDFSEAYKNGLAKCERWWIEEGKKGMLGKIKGFNPTIYLAFMNNKFPGWNRENMKSENRTQINIGNMNVLQYQNKTADQLKQILLDKLGSQELIEYSQDSYDHTQDDNAES